MERAEVSAYENERLKKLAERPNTTVFTVQHDAIGTAWPVARVRNVLESIAKRIQDEFSDTEKHSDFAVRKACMQDEEVLAFQRQHPKLYWMVTDREKMKNERYRSAVSALLEIRRRVEKGQIPEGHEADAAATRTVIDALQTK